VNDSILFVILMFSLIAQNPNNWFSASELAEKIKEVFPSTFSQTETPITWSFPFSGM